jgi:hypothetical protein
LPENGAPTNKKTRMISGDKNTASKNSSSGTSSSNPGIQPWMNNYIDCPICFASLKSMQDLKRHIKSCHPDEENPLDI